jgi:hypothetical protein
VGSRMRVDALQHIDEILGRPHAVRAGGREQALYDAGVLRANLRPAEEPVFSIMDALT